ncbi:hypothetical protein [Streptomyces sp. NL15-2K]|uniref:hypothetical protein n=1 Tax=Streptomyces sp. NL15-2K TaxID=376149 RepID=UPI0026EE6F6C|nr:hypothetical protein [Kutzneria buriramensis]WKX10946.1 hypothetical protein Q4V64_26945 [Kutzneria buriramensis]
MLSRGAGIPVHRLGPRSGDHGVVAPYGGDDTLLAPGLTRLGVAHRHAQGAHIVTHRVDTTAGTLPDRHDLLLLVRPDGRLVPADGRAAPAPQPGDIAVMRPRC